MQQFSFNPAGIFSLKDTLKIYKGKKNDTIIEKHIMNNSPFEKCKKFKKNFEKYTKNHSPMDYSPNEKYEVYDELHTY